MNVLKRFRWGLLMAAAGLICAPMLAEAAGGRVELNQTSILAAGGFPFLIDEPGSYVLTSDLTVPADTDGIHLGASDVVFDLNGFAIEGPASCASNACPKGDGSAIRPKPSTIGTANQIAVRNGRIRGFADNCLTLRSFAEVAHLVVRDCGSRGISVGSGSLVHHNRVLETGRQGIFMASEPHPASFSHNTIGQAGLDDGSPAVTGGRPSAGNSCDDGSCSARGLRRYYLTTDAHPADEALAACADGYHMASLFEIMNPSALEYDVRLGNVIPGGSVPPTGGVGEGWVRNGFASQPDSNNCLQWTTDSDSEHGHVAQFGTDFLLPRTFHPFFVLLQDCDSLRRVWCVEN